MRSQAQYTIYSLNDVVTSATAPTSPYLGQLWVDTSKSPPVTMVWNGSAWKEQNGTDTIRTSIKTIETKEATLETNLNGLKSTVSSISKTVEVIESDTAEAQENILALQTNVSELEQTASSIALRVTQNESNISSLTVSHNAVAARVSTAEGNITTLKADVSGLESRVEDTEGNISTLTQTVDGIDARVEDAEGNITTLTTRTNSLRTQITNINGNISSLEQTVEGIETRVSDSEGNISSLTQTTTSLTTRITTAEGAITTHTTDISGLKTRISNAEGDITSLETSVSGITTRVTTAEGDISTLEQTTTSLSATVATKVGQTGGASSSFGWSLTSSGFYLYSNSSTVMSVTSSGLTISGKITASSGTIGGFTIGSSSIYKTKTSYSSTTAGVYIGTNGIGLGAGTFYVTSAGYLKSTSGNIGGFTISSSAIYKTKTSYSSTTAGVYLGTTGIGLGAGTFYVTSAGYLYATNANISGTITATSGSFENCDIGETCYIYGYLYCSGSEEVKYYGSKQDVSYETYMIFNMYLSGMGRNAIVKKLMELGIPCKNGGRWSESTIWKMLQNEKYAGDLLLQKTFVVDHISKKKQKNTGQLPQYLIEGNHEAIIDRETFQRVQDEIARRRKKHTPASPTAPSYEFTQKIVCEQCGKHYRRKTVAGGKVVWICATFNRLGKAHCPSQQIPEEILKGLIGNTAFSEIRIPCANTVKIVHPNGKVETHTWQNPSRSESWTAEMKETARRRHNEWQQKRQ